MSPKWKICFEIHEIAPKLNPEVIHSQMTFRELIELKNRLSINFSKNGKC